MDSHNCPAGTLCIVVLYDCFFKDFAAWAGIAPANSLNHANRLFKPLLQPLEQALQPALPAALLVAL